MVDPTRQYESEFGPERTEDGLRNLKRELLDFAGYHRTEADRAFHTFLTESQRGGFITDRMATAAVSHPILRLALEKFIEYQNGNPQCITETEDEESEVKNFDQYSEITFEIMRQYSQAPNDSRDQTYGMNVGEHTVDIPLLVAAVDQGVIVRYEATFALESPLNRNRIYDQLIDAGLMKNPIGDSSSDAVD